MATKEELAQEIADLKAELEHLEGRFTLLVEYTLERDQIKGRDDIAKALRSEG